MNLALVGGEFIQVGREPSQMGGKLSQMGGELSQRGKKLSQRDGEKMVGKTAGKFWWGIQAGIFLNGELRYPR